FFVLWNRILFLCLAPTSPRPPCTSFRRTAGEGVRRLLGSRKNSKRKPGFTLFFLLPYGVMAEYQPFKFFNRN
ncbi:hypothetical protein, partial [Bacteroides thetaiotaomicron]|uniref:hypothetical protein n=1 Tax=Bacteroides thetaiotaomicron TaxID=818 RepID=UPI001C3FF9A2